MIFIGILIGGIAGLIVGVVGTILVVRAGTRMAIGRTNREKDSLSTENLTPWNIGHGGT